jgi:3-oxoacyl-[acyl-carrier protein] reductase
MRNVIVTGGSRGLGLGIVRLLLRSGYGVIAIARRQTAELIAAADTAPGALRFVPFDLTELTALPDTVKDIRSICGPIYGLVNNAGVGTSGLLTMMPDAQIEAVLRTNAIAPILLTKYVARAMMVDGRGGRIVNMASIVASAGFGGLSAYSASKAALIGFTRSLARELGPLNITVNAVAPGFIDTDMTHDLTPNQRDQVVRRSALKRLAGVEDVAASVEFLLSDRSKNITGTVLTVDAGGTA